MILGVASDGDVAWASAGSLIRSAMTMGLHRDPTRFRKINGRRDAAVERDLEVQLDDSCPKATAQFRVEWSGMLQTQTLLLVARLGVASDGDVAWASAGSLIRSAGLAETSRITM
jgi:hypothetical protein